MNEIFKYLKHLTREILIYWLSGFIILFDIIIIDFFHYNESIFKFLITHKDLSSLFIIVMIFICYILGQISMGLGYLLLEKTKIEEKIKKCCKIEKFENKGYQEKIFKENPALYEFFIERYDNLSYMRWNLSISFLICFVINFIYSLKSCFWQITLLSYLSFTFFIVLYILYLKTEKDLQQKINNFPF